MTDIKISALGGIYLEEAMRRLAEPTKRLLPWSGKVEQALEWWLEKAKRELRPDRAGFLSFPKSWMGSYPELASANFLFGRAHVDPFRMDVFDCLVILASNDIDLAHDKNHRGPTKR